MYITEVDISKDTNSTGLAIKECLCEIFEGLLQASFSCNFSTWNIVCRPNTHFFILLIMHEQIQR